MPDVQHREHARAASDEQDRRAPLSAAVFGCLLRAVVVTCAAGYQLGQVIDRHTGPPLIDLLAGGGGLFALLVVAAMTWLELALLQTWPRVGLCITAFWSVTALVLGSFAAVTGTPLWLVPAAVFALPPLVSLVQPAAWRLPPLRWHRPRLIRVAELTVVHSVGVVAYLVVWTGAVASAPWLGGILLAFVLGLWLLGALGKLPTWRSRHESPEQSGLLVAPQVAGYVLLVLFVGSAVG